MKRVVSFSLWGENPFYHEGALRALDSVGSAYPGWESWIYVAEDVPEVMVKRLAERATRVVRLIRREKVSTVDSRSKFQYEPAFWRFFPAADPEVERILVRDADSPLTMREAAAVREWIESDLDFHIMRDHPKHEYPIMAGMWGAKSQIMRDIVSLVEAWESFDFYGCDQTFLGKVIYPRIRSCVMIHSECVAFPGETVRPFPSARAKNEFVGISHTGDDARLSLQIRYLNDWIGSGCPVELRPWPWSLGGLLRRYSRGLIMNGKSLPSIVKKIGRGMS